MGQAKRRGSYEERVKQAIERAEDEADVRRLEAAEKRRREQEAFEAMSPEEQEKVRRRRRYGAYTMIGLAGLMGGRFL